MPPTNDFLKNALFSKLEKIGNINKRFYVTVNISREHSFESFVIRELMAFFRELYNGFFALFP